MINLLPDLMALIGLVMLGVGVGLYSVPMALISVGGLLILLGISTARKQGANNDT